MKFIPFSKCRKALRQATFEKRKGTKVYVYTDYIKHYVIGFVYKRNDCAQESRVYDYSNRSEIEFPYFDVQYFMQEKYRIAGDKPGSGNTENIG